MRESSLMSPTKGEKEDTEPPVMGMEESLETFGQRATARMETCFEPKETGEKDFFYLGYKMKQTKDGIVATQNNDYKRKYEQKRKETQHGTMRQKDSENEGTRKGRSTSLLRPLRAKKSNKKRNPMRTK